MTELEYLQMVIQLKSNQVLNQPETALLNNYIVEPAESISEYQGLYAAYMKNTTADIKFKTPEIKHYNNVNILNTIE